MDDKSHDESEYEGVAVNQLTLFDRAISHGDRVAVTAASQSWSYTELVKRSESIAASLLRDCDDLHESRIAFLVPAGFDYISVQWGIWRAGGIAVPLSLSATQSELEYVLSDSRVSLLITSESLQARVSTLAQSQQLPWKWVESIEESADKVLPEVAAERRAMILYTSGTTSKPKGVVTTHACIQSQIESLIEAWHWQADDRIPLFLPLHHIHGIINVMSCALWSGAQIEVFPRFETDAILSRVGQQAYSVFMAVPTIYVKLIETLESMSAEQRESLIAGFAAMRLMVSGSAALPASVHETWTQLTGQKLLERYGMTEIGMALSNPYVGERRPGAVGQPLPGVQVRLQSEQGETISDEHVSGEIQVRGNNVFLEYWNRADATVASFQDGWFRTGDMAVIEHGYYRIMGAVASISSRVVATSFRRWKSRQPFWITPRSRSARSWDCLTRHGAKPLRPRWSFGATRSWSLMRSVHGAKIGSLTTRFLASS